MNLQFSGYYPGYGSIYPGYYNAGYRNLGYLGYNPYNLLNAPFRQAQLLAPVRQTPVPVPALDSTPGTQYHFQDNNGNINYGYSNINSAKHEVGNTYSGVQGEYSYVDANGIQQMVSYVADEGGFRIISDSRLQALEALAPKVPMLADQSIPAAEPLKASPETRRKREAEAYYGFGYGAPYYGHYASPYSMGYYGNGFGYYFG